MNFVVVRSLIVALFALLPFTITGEWWWLAVALFWGVIAVKDATPHREPLSIPGDPW